jgi:hypothetical protein
MKRTFFAALLTAGLGVAQPASAAQPRPAPVPAPAAAPQAPAAALVVDEQSARDTQRRLQELLRDYPPTLTQVLQLDPVLMTNATYLAPYPSLAAFVAQHPDIVHHAAFYLGQPNDYREDSTTRAVRAFSDVAAYAATTIGFIAFFITISWLARLVVDHRRWLRASKIQTEAQAKLFDRLTSNDDLLAYIHSPAGSRFLQPAPMPIDAGPRFVGAPVGRILWSAQAGVVLAVVGLGLRFAKGNIIQELNGPLNVVAVLAISLGLGFAISAAVAFGMSHRLGLLEPPKP